MSDSAIGIHACLSNLAKSGRTVWAWRNILNDYFKGRLESSSNLTPSINLLLSPSMIREAILGPFMNKVQFLLGLWSRGVQILTSAWHKFYFYKFQLGCERCALTCGRPSSRVMIRYFSSGSVHT